MNKESYYICPNCGELSTLTKQLDACSGGGMPYCYCKFMPERIFVEYKKINQKLWGQLNTIKIDRLRLKKYLEYRLNSIKLKSKGANG